MIDIVDRLRFDATRCELQFSKGVAGNIEEAAKEIERLRDKPKAIDMTEVDKDKLIARYREALDLIWHIAPLPTQTERELLVRIHGIARNALWHPEKPLQT